MKKAKKLTKLFFRIIGELKNRGAFLKQIYENFDQIYVSNIE